MQDLSHPTDNRSPAVPERPESSADFPATEADLRLNDEDIAAIHEALEA